MLRKQRVKTAGLCPSRPPPCLLAKGPHLHAAHPRPTACLTQLYPIGEEGEGAELVGGAIHTRGCCTALPRYRTARSAGMYCSPSCSGNRQSLAPSRKATGVWDEEPWTG